MPFFNRRKNFQRQRPSAPAEPRPKFFKRKPIGKFERKPILKDVEGGRGGRRGRGRGFNKKSRVKKKKRKKEKKTEIE